MTHHIDTKTGDYELPGAHNRKKNPQQKRGWHTQKKEIQNITTKRNSKLFYSFLEHNLVKKREHEAKLLENYLVSKKKATIIGISFIKN